MNQIDRLMEMARQVGAVENVSLHGRHDNTVFTIGELEQFFALIAESEREAIIAEIPGGTSVDPQWVCDMIRARGKG